MNDLDCKCNSRCYIVLEEKIEYEKDTLMEVIAVLKKLRKEKGWSQEDLAHELGVSFSTINRWENGKTKPSKMAQAHINKLLILIQKRRVK